MCVVHIFFTSLERVFPILPFADIVLQILAGKARFETASPEEHSKCAK